MNKKKTLSDAYVKAVGESEVRLKQYVNDYENLRQRAITVKQLSLKNARTIESYKEKLAVIKSETPNKVELIKSYESRIAMCESNALLFDKINAESKIALEKAAIGFENAKTQISFYQDQIVATKAMTSFESALDEGTISQEMNSYLESLKDELDKARSTLEIDSYDFHITE